MPRPATEQGRLEPGSNIPGSSGQETVDQRRLKRPGLEVLDKGWLVESNASGERLGDDSLAFRDELRGESEKGRLVSHFARQSDYTGGWFDVRSKGDGNQESRECARAQSGKNAMLEPGITAEEVEGISGEKNWVKATVTVRPEAFGFGPCEETWTRGGPGGRRLGNAAQQQHAQDPQPHDRRIGTRRAGGAQKRQTTKEELTYQAPGPARVC
jgi:hypothetical protein